MGGVAVYLSLAWPVARGPSGALTFQLSQSALSHAGGIGVMTSRLGCIFGKQLPRRAGPAAMHPSCRVQDLRAGLLKHTGHVW